MTQPADSTLTPEQLASAEALVAAALDMDTLAETQRAESGSVGSSGLIALRYPAASIQTLTLGGAPAAGVLSGPRTLDVKALVNRSYGNPWGSGYSNTPYAVQYTSGWTADTLPEQIRQAVLAVAAAGVAAAESLGIKSETMGPRSVTYADTSTSGTVGADSLALLRPWLAVRF